MSRADRVPAIDLSQPEALAAVAGALRLIVRPAHKPDGRATFYRSGLERGSLLWVREDYVEFEPRRRPLLAPGISYGGMTRVRKPQHLRNIECKTHIHQARDMHRSMSRLTLEITRTKVFRLADLDETLLSAAAVQRVCRDGVAGWMPYGETYYGFRSSVQSCFRDMWDAQVREEYRRRGDLPVVGLCFIIHHTNIANLRLAVAA